jgi:hypothetical protein
MAATRLPATDRHQLVRDPAASVALVPVDPTTCPDCGGQLRTIEAAQAALVRHGGYGATLRQTIRYCLGCLYSIHIETTEIRP